MVEKNGPDNKAQVSFSGRTQFSPPTLNIIDPAYNYVNVDKDWTHQIRRGG
ncbi:hypothetical protein JCM14722_07190 [Pseudodesulfovibrio portus]|uniref:Uncharacterized protein n=1 Tax=Pseudodesulfovibrio portus TaxID=231439 RepID=A0ABM8AP41_9BACT|nr:hypothetical protein JCM14722_07190 [Pseudodesulfovibrio portus]